MKEGRRDKEKQKKGRRKQRRNKRMQQRSERRQMGNRRMQQRTERRQMKTEGSSTEAKSEGRHEKRQ